MNSIFGIPYYKNKINPLSYKKEEIIRTIEENYKRSSFRNKWGHGDDNIHHYYNDVENSDFLSIDYNELAPLYILEINNFLNELPLKKVLNYKLKIENYTATANNQSMSSHHHIPSLFYCIHYLKFDPESHKPTAHSNSHEFSKYFLNLYPGIYDFFDESDINNSWVHEWYSLNTEEDDFLIMPSVISHQLKGSLSNSLRISIAMNVYLDS